jgi:hypothetical protein
MNDFNTNLPAIPPGATVVYDQTGHPYYLPANQPVMGPPVMNYPQAQAPIVVQMPSQPVPPWLRNAMIAAVGILILSTPAVVLLVVAAPALAAAGQAVAYGGIGIGIGVIGVAAAIKALRETPKAPRPVKPVKRVK